PLELRQLLALAGDGDAPRLERLLARLGPVRQVERVLAVGAIALSTDAQTKLAQVQPLVVGDLADFVGRGLRQFDAHGYLARPLGRLYLARLLGRLFGPPFLTNRRLLSRSRRRVVARPPIRPRRRAGPQSGEQAGLVMPVHLGHLL